ncbi:hypothetical protein [[Erwinia] mediterraneensis]|uniref:hypothetical protein n=1 Tax=[Erwinia] mediterraneensis TaxID=2161819 RepID=UPI00103057CC|nr:hypothetical protein [[Erwinia] mediterraneensis]
MKYLTLCLSRPVSRVMLEDLKAIIPGDALRIFINGLDEQRYTTLECVQDERFCALIASAIIVWRQLGYINTILFQSGELTRRADDASQFQLFTMMKTSRAILQVA